VSGKVIKLTDVIEVADALWVRKHKALGWIKLNLTTGIWERKAPEQIQVSILELANGLARDAAILCQSLGIRASWNKKQLDDAQVGQDAREAWETANLWAVRNDLTWARRCLDGLAGITFFEDELDTDPMLIGTPAGVLDLRNGQILDPRLASNHYVTKSTNIDPSDTIDPEFSKFLDIFEPSTLDWMRWQLARVLVGQASREFFVFTGDGSNGKSMINDLMQGFLGEYAKVVSANVMDSQKSETHLATLRGVRLAVMEETEAGARLMTKALKDLVETPLISARELYGAPFTFRASHSIFLMTNHVPQVDTGSYSVSRRMVKVTLPWEYRAAGDIDPTNPRHRPRTIADKHAFCSDPKVQGSLFRWLLDAVNLPEPARPVSVQAENEAWVQENDITGQFIDETFKLNPQGQGVPAEILHRRFADWRDRNGYSRINRNTSAEKIRVWMNHNPHVTKVRKASGVVYLGIDP
jgi:P4 family phage/plasmid primase-like protien